MGNEHSFSILKNYPMERAYTLTKENKKTIFEKLGTMLKKK